MGTKRIAAGCHFNLFCLYTIFKKVVQCSYVSTDLLFNSLLTGCGNKSLYHYIFYDKQGSK